MAFQERLLPLSRVGPVHRLARERQSQREQETLGADPGQIDPQVREVDLRLGPGLMGLRHERFLHSLPGRGQDLWPLLRDVIPDRRVGQVSQLVVIDQPRQDPAGRMPLLTRRRQVLGQHRVDQALRRIQFRSRPRRGPPLRRDRVAQGLPDRPAVHPMPVSQRPDGQLLQPLITTYRLEQLHPRPRHFRPSRSPPTTRRAFGVGPDQTVITRPGRVGGGAKSVRPVTVGPVQTDIR